MGVSKWTAGPVAILGVLALLSVLNVTGAGSESFGTITFQNYNGDISPIVYYDGFGNPTTYYNGSAYRAGESGWVREYIYQKDLAFWSNSSGHFQLYKDPAHTQLLKLSDLSGAIIGQSNTGGFDTSISTTLGLIAFISGIVAVGVIASVKIFGFGLSDVGINTLMKGSVYILIWAFFSGLAMNLIVSAGDLATPIIYLALTGVFAFGVMGEIGTPSSG